MPYTYIYPRPCVTVDIILVQTHEDDPRILLIRRKNPPFEGCWALPGGFVEMDEDLETATRRELMEETGLVAETLRQFKTYGAIHRDPRHRTITVVYFALINESPGRPQSGDDASDAAWFGLFELPDLAFDHAQIIRDFFAFLSPEKQQL